MTYDRKKILKMLEKAPLNPFDSFHEGKNGDFISAIQYSCFNGNFNYKNGATKLVLIPESEEDYVIKIPYTGCWSQEEGFYSNDVYHSGYTDYLEFCNGEGQENEWDYCEGEVQRYQIAKENGLEQCFAKTEFVGYINDYPIYVQEKCVTFSSCSSEHQHSKEERSKTAECCYYYSINTNWLTDFRLYYGEKFLLKFINFIQNKYWDDDLRNENIGYCSGRPVLIDYSGFLD